MFGIPFTRHLVWVLVAVLEIIAFLPFGEAQQGELRFVSNFEQLQIASADGVRHIVLTDHINVGSAQARKGTDGSQSPDLFTLSAATVSVTVRPLDAIAWLQP